MAFEWLKKQAEKGKQEIEEKVGDKLMEEEVNPTLRQHHGEPIKNPKDKS